MRLYKQNSNHRWIRGTIGFVILVFGVNILTEPWHTGLTVVGLILLGTALWGRCLFKLPGTG